MKKAHVTRSDDNMDGPYGFIGYLPDPDGTKIEQTRREEGSWEA